ncbi:hypothetical protein AVEN_189714-1 [Araneus ventricosus]|uniref:Uncharacterized protein n=1 Tax=Araneus ventricosus TaxID=182803 RepID=A0A4Y2J0P6_ARAVE|nr:hypothetical protein AVEN_189714-1 [Araneus ventricosus]
MFPAPDSPTNYSQFSNNTKDDPPFSGPEVSYVIKNIPSGKAPGLDGIDYLVIKILHGKHPFLLSNFFNKCLNIGHSPFKTGNIVFFLKQGKDPTLPSSFRPISLLPSLGKVLERLLTRSLTFQLEKENYISQNQHGFRAGRSVDTALKNLLGKNRRRSKKIEAFDYSINRYKGSLRQSSPSSDCQGSLRQPLLRKYRKIFTDLLQHRKVSIFTPQG